MRKLTQKQQKFVIAKIAGRRNRDAAIEAGYSRSTASVAATKLMNLASVKKAIAAGNMMAKEMGVSNNDDDPMEGVNCEDSMTFLKAMVGNPKLSMSMRARAAEQLMPYQHARIGEKGKKEKRTDDAHGVVKGGKFAPKAQPRLASVTPIRR